MTEPQRHRWYPVIDYSRCANCLECVDFCLFGVYGIDDAARIFVEQPDNCRPGCPACSRICPQRAIIFPQHRDPAIAGGTMPAPRPTIDPDPLPAPPDLVQIGLAECTTQPGIGDRTREPQPGRTQARRSDPTARQANDALDDLINSVDQLDL